MPDHPMRAEHSFTQELTEELRSVVDGALGEKVMRAINDASRDTAAIRREDVYEVILGLAMRMTEREIVEMINANRINAGLEPIQIRVPYYRKKYEAIIDEVYAQAATRIGEVFKFADKMIRISKYNDLATALENRLQSRLRDETGTVNLDLTLKVANTYVRVLDRLNIEMGQNNGKMILTKNKPWEKPEEEPPEAIENVEEAKRLAKEAIMERFRHQLPAVVTEKMVYSDYEHCAFAERLGEDQFTCWSMKMNGGTRGGPCAVQAGTVKECPHFLNKNLIDNPEWLEKTKGAMTMEQLAVAAGCTEYDDEVYERIKGYFKKYGISLKRKKEAIGSDE